MASGVLLYPKIKSFLASGVPNAGGKVSTFAAGTSTPQAAYADALLTTPLANPIVLDANGEALAYCLPLPYKLQFTDSAGGSVPGGTVDNYYPAGLFNLVNNSQWFPILKTDGFSAPTFGFTSATQFTVNAGYDLIATYGLAVGDRIKTQNTGGVVYSTIVSISYGAPNDTITVVNDGAGVIDAGISQLFIGLVRYANPSYLDPRSSMEVTKNGNQVGFAGSTQVTTWNAAAPNSLSEWSGNVFTAKYAGDYLVNASVEISNTVASIAHTLTLSGSVSLSALFESSATATRHTTLTMTRLVTLSAGNTITLFVTGDANTTVYGTSATQINIVRRP